MRLLLKKALPALLCGLLACPLATRPAHADNAAPAQAAAGAGDYNPFADSEFGDPDSDVKGATAAIQVGGDRDTLIAAYNRRADALRGLRRFKEAAADYGKVLELCRRAPAIKNYVGVASYFRGLAEIELGDGDGAAADFTAAIADENDWSDAFLGRARARYLQGDLAGARADAKQAKAFLRTEKAKADWKEPVFEEAMAAANKAVHDDPAGGAAARCSRGVLHFQDALTGHGNGPAEMRSARSDFESAATLDPKAPAPFFDLALTQIALNGGRSDVSVPFHREVILGNLREAEALDAKYTPVLAAHAIFLASTPVSAGVLPDAAEAATTAKANAQALPDAFALLDKAAALEPGAGEWPMLMAALETQRRQPDTAKLIAYFTRAAALEPHGLPAEIGWLWPGVVPPSMTAPQGTQGRKDAFKADALAGRARIYAATSDADHALADIDTSLKLQDQKSGHLLRARIDSQKKDWDGVIADANAALGDAGPALDDSGRADALLLRATAWDRKGEFAKAQADVDAALKIDPKRIALIKGSRYDKTQPPAK